MCVCFVGYLGKKNPMYQQETTIRQRVNVRFFYIPSGNKFNFFTLIFLVKQSVKIAKI